MIDPEHSGGDGALRALQETLRSQRRMVQKLRSDYATIDRSKFARLRTMWLLFKSLFRRGGLEPPFATASNLSMLRVVQLPAAPSAPSVAMPAAPQLESPGLEELAAALAMKASAQSDAAPMVSIVIPAHNNFGLTERCIRSLIGAWPQSIPCEIIVVDDASTDRISACLARLPGITVVRNGSNEGFVGSCNRGAALARGKYVVFLNNDTVVKDGWLDYLVSAAESDARIGAAGSKLIGPDGTLQEAGAIIFRDGSGWNFGRNEAADAFQFNFTRDVDYCSGAALLVRSDLFRTIGGFGAEFAPGYYEDADLCFEVRSRGFRVVYEPRSEVVHYEGSTAGTDEAAGMKRFQNVNRPKFVQKWHDVLQAHAENAPANVWAAARRQMGRRTILVIDSYVPLYDRDAGSLRLLEIIRILRGAGYHVIFAPDNFAAIAPYTSELLAMGVEQIYYNGKNGPIEDRLREALPYVDLAWVCRPDLTKKYAPLVREFGVPVIYDTIDLHFMRTRRQAAVDPSVKPDAWKALESLEIALASAADATVVVTEQERDELQSRGIRDVRIIPTIHNRTELPVPAFAERSGVMFIGGYNHVPNVDAARWLCTQIMPRVWERLPEVRVSLLGSNPPKELYDLANERVDVVGFVKDAEPYFLNSRVFAAALRYGAGMKGKIGQSLSLSLPVVTTSIGLDGYALKHERNCLVADDTEGFAEAIVRLHSDRALWDAISARSFEAIRNCQSAVVAADLLKLLDDVVSRREAHVAATV